MQTMWNKDEEDFLFRNHESMSVQEIADILKRSHSSVENKKSKMGLKGVRKYNFNFDFFKYPLNEVSAYWLGFISADGYISSNKEFAIQLKEDDFEHLKKFNKDLSGNIPVTFSKKKERYICGKVTPESKLCQIRIFSTQMVSDLANLGVYANKSKTIRFPRFLDDKMTWCFLRGYFDGDGSIYYDLSSNQLRAKITSGSKDFRDGFCEFLKRFGIKTYVTEQGSGLDCGVTGKECHKIFFSNLYDNSSVFLDRKYKKYKKYKHLYGLCEQ